MDTDEQLAAERAKLPDNLGDAPGAMEAVIVWSISPFTAAIYKAAIVRHADGPPTLGEWRDLNKHGKVEEDRFTQRIQQSLIAIQ